MKTATGEPKSPKSGHSLGGGKARSAGDRHVTPCVGGRAPAMGVSGPRCAGPHDGSLPDDPGGLRVPNPFRAAATPRGCNALWSHTLSQLVTHKDVSPGFCRETTGPTGFSSSSGGRRGAGGGDGGDLSRARQGRMRLTCAGLLGGRRGFLVSV